MNSPNGKSIQKQIDQLSQSFTINSNYKQQEYISKKTQEKIIKLNDKWQVTQQVSEKNKREIKNEFLDIIHGIDEFMNIEKSNDDNKFKEIKDMIVHLQDSNYQDNNKFEEMELNQLKEIRSLGEKLQQAMIEEKINKQQTQSQHLIMINEKNDQVLDDVQRSNQQFSQFREKKTRELSDQIKQLKQLFVSTQEHRDESQFQMKEKIENEIQLFEDMIQTENQLRQDTQKKMLQVIDEVNIKLQQELKNEKFEREQTTEQILKLIEQTCQKLDPNFLQ